MKLCMNSGRMNEWIKRMNEVISKWVYVSGKEDWINEWLIDRMFTRNEEEEEEER